MVIAPPTHIENHLLGYRPMLGFDGADVIADEVYTTATLGMEKHLIDLFGDAGLEYEEASNLAQATGDTRHKTADAPIEPTSLAPPGLVSPAWAPEAQAMLKKVPFFVRGRVQKNVERYAAEQGQLLITAEVLQTAKEALGG